MYRFDAADWIDLLVNLLAVWGCNAIACIVPYTLGEKDGQLNGIKMAHILELLKPRLLIHASLEANSLPKCTVQQVHCLQWRNTSFPKSEFPNPPAPSDCALIQLTSGSTAYPKGVKLLHSQLHANMRSICNRTGMTEDDHMLSWLPLYHDMGLSSLLLTVYKNLSLTLIPTNHFVRNPKIWMEAISKLRATYSVAPTFAYALISRLCKNS